MCEAQEVHDPVAVAFLCGVLECGLPGHVAHRATGGEARPPRSSSRLTAAWGVVAPSMPHLASTLTLIARSTFTASGYPASATNHRGVLSSPPPPAASIDVKEDEKDADEDKGLAKKQLRDIVAVLGGGHVDGVVPLARRSYSRAPP